MVRVIADDRYVKIVTSFPGDELLPVEAEKLIMEIRKAIDEVRRRKSMPRAFYK